ncbi:MAG: glycine betaine ABC transporter substrate-binding protein [Cardiobacteriaceae bacterium]|nr:glycine betaine ABC transporter substrate-binding protein [Cardiobacteriaceae bacterium]
MTKFKLFFTVIMMSLLIGCEQKSSTMTDDVVTIASKPMTEQFILTEMLAMLIEHDSHLQVKLEKGIGGGTANIHPALLKGEVDIYPEYTGTAWFYVLKQPIQRDEAALLTELKSRYHDDYNLEWLGLYGFNNTYGLAIRKSIVDTHKIKTYSDLAPYSADYTLGAEYDFYEREDGYQSLADTYGYHFKKKIDLDIGLKYPAINSAQVDVINIFTTDGQLTSPEITVLEDDKHLYPNYYAGTVVRRATLEKHPELRTILLKMDGIINNQEMQQLNYQVEHEGKSDHEVAAAYLKMKGLLP